MDDDAAVRARRVHQHDDEAARRIDAYIVEQLAHYLAEDDGWKPGVDYVLCRVEGCPRATPAGQIKACGAARIGLDLGTDDQFCGASTTVHLWERNGLMPW